MNEIIMEAICKTIAAWYSSLVGQPCEATYFVVRKDNACGFYSVQRLGSCDFYEVHIHKVERLEIWGIA